MKIVIRERNTSCTRSGFSLLPSLFFQWGDGCVNNLETGRVQRNFELEIHFDFLFFQSLIAVHLIWGDEGEIEEEVCLRYRYYDDDDQIWL